MAFLFKDLDAKTRAFMLEEVAYDLECGSLYLSRRFNADGKENYPELITLAVEQHDEAWLADEIRSNDYMKEVEIRQTKRGASRSSVPHNAAETFAEGEFNRFYIRGVCKRALENGDTEVEVYRAKAVRDPRYASQQKIGTKVSARQLLDDLRASPGVETALGLPAGPNSGLSVCLC